MNFEFSLAEVLERLVPGTFLIVIGAYILQLDLSYFAAGDAKFIVSVVAFCFAYAAGTALNIVGSFLKLDNKNYWNGDDKHIAKIREAVQEYFKTETTERSWKLCYGVCHKNGYTVKSELFSRLNVFCRSMALCLLLLVLLATCIMVTNRTLSAKYIWVFWLLGTGALIFAYGARLYSRAFIGSIYEGFNSYYCSLPSRQL